MNTYQFMLVKNLASISTNYIKTLGFFGINPELPINNWQAEANRMAIFAECRILISQQICLIVNGLDDFNTPDSCTKKLKSDRFFNKLSVIKDMNEISLFLNSRAEYNDRTYGKLANQIINESYFELQEFLLRYNRSFSILNNTKYLEIWQVSTLGARQVSCEDFIGYNSIEFNKYVEPLLEFEGRIYLKLGSAFKKSIKEITSRIVGLKNPILVALD